MFPLYCCLSHLHWLLINIVSAQRPGWEASYWSVWCWELNIRPAYLPNGIEPNGIRHPDSNGEQHSKAESISASSLASMGLEYALLNKTAGNSPGTYGTNLHQQIRSPVSSNGTNNYPDVKLPNVYNK